MKFAVIIPDRGDRELFLAHCYKQMERMTLKPDAVYRIGYPPRYDGFDLTQRIRDGVMFAKQDGYDLVFIMENDDHYPADYFERFAPFFDQYEFFGDDHTTYYHLKNKTYRTWHHPYRSSLFTTGFKISALNLFEWPPNDYIFFRYKTMGVCSTQEKEIREYRRDRYETRCRENWWQRSLDAFQGC